MNFIDVSIDGSYACKHCGAELLVRTVQAQPRTTEALAKQARDKHDPVCPGPRRTAGSECMVCGGPITPETACVDLRGTYHRSCEAGVDALYPAPGIDTATKAFVYDDIIRLGLARPGRVLEDVLALAALAAKPEPKKPTLLGYRLRCHKDLHPETYGYWDIAKCEWTWTLNGPKPAPVDYETAKKEFCGTMQIVRVVRRAK